METDGRGRGREREMLSISIYLLHISEGTYNCNIFIIYFVRLISKSVVAYCLLRTVIPFVRESV